MTKEDFELRVKNEGVLRIMPRTNDDAEFWLLFEIQNGATSLDICASQVAIAEIIRYLQLWIAP